MTEQQRVRRVVIIDDEAVLSTVLAEIVGGLGYETIVFPDSGSSPTYELIDSDVVFIDILTLHMSGFHILEQLARQNVKSAIVLMSAKEERLYEAEKLAMRLNLYLIGVLTTPFRLADVRGILEGV